LPRSRKAGPPTPTISSTIHCRINSKTFSFSKAFGYSREEIENSIRRQILKNEGETEIEANENDGKEIKPSPDPSFCLELLIEHHTKRQKDIENLSAVLESPEK
jgi:hypothetical protein